jgi:hypothetical protein
LQCEYNGTYDELSRTCLCDDEHFGARCEHSVVAAIEANSTTVGQTHDVPLSPNATVVVAAPLRAPVPDFVLVPSEDSPLSPDTTPLPTTVAGPVASSPPPPQDEVTNTTLPIGEPMPISSTQLGFATVVGGSLVTGLLVVIGAVVL